VELVTASLDDDKAHDVVVIDLAGKTDFADFMVIATGTSQRHVATMAEHLREKLKSAGHGKVPVEGLEQGEWVLIDGGDVIVHLFKAEVRKFYDLEKIWGAPVSRARQVAQV
jgi:ribosome-associated protein